MIFIVVCRHSHRIFARDEKDAACRVMSPRGVWGHVEDLGYGHRERV